MYIRRRREKERKREIVHVEECNHSSRIYLEAISHLAGSIYFIAQLVANTIYRSLVMISQLDKLLFLKPLTRSCRETRRSYIQTH